MHPHAPPHPHPPTSAFHAASLCHLGPSIKNVLSPESRPIKGRIPGRRADKAYLINKSSGIIGARVPRHTPPLISNYPSVSFCQTGRRGTARGVIAAERRGSRPHLSVSGQRGCTENTVTCGKSYLATSGTCKQMQMARSGDSSPGIEFRRRSPGKAV